MTDAIETVSWPTWRERHPRISIALRATAVCLPVTVGTVLVIDGLLLGAESLIGPLVLAWPVASGVAFFLLLLLWIAALPSVERQASARTIILLSLVGGVSLGIFGFMMLGLWHGHFFGFAPLGAMFLSFGMGLAIKESHGGQT